MIQNKPTRWYNVYRQIAEQLDDFYGKNEDHAGEQLFSIINESSIYKKNNSWLLNFKRIKNPTLDPIQLFASFNRNRQKENIRIEIIKELCRVLAIKTNWMQIDFEGCPTPVALKLQYIRSKNEQINIWQVFHDIMRGKKALTQVIWEEAKSWRGIRTPSFTIFMFWVNSKYFLPLDKNMRQYLERSGLVEANSLMSFEVYKGLLLNKKIKDYRRLSSEAYYFINQPKIFKNRFANGALIPQPDLKNERFRLVGLRTLNRNYKVHKILKPKTYYPFDNTLMPSDTNDRKSNHLRRFDLKNAEAESLYDLESLKINITAIVGKNGSGKSSLLDLLLMGIYNLSIKLGYLGEEHDKTIALLNFEVYWHADTLYKLVFDKEITFYRFTQTANESKFIFYQLDDKPMNIGGLIENFFYSILVNYSHYALNSADYETDWITPLSHKNDGYITPVVINPKRTKGNIDINNQKDLLNMRLLLNLLELHDPDIPEQSFRFIDNNKYLKYFSLSFDTGKNREKESELNQIFFAKRELIKMAATKITEAFHLHERKNVKIKYNQEIEYYILHKSITITERYDPYTQKYKERLQDIITHSAYLDGDELDPKSVIALGKIIVEILEDIAGDTSHIALKLKQAVNYLRYPALRKYLSTAIKNKGRIELDKYNLLVSKIINDNLEENLTVAELLPPAIFKLDFHIDDSNTSSFNKASSGEYQLLSVLSSILYHIRNIDSVNGENEYHYITVLLDEIELYFHPNMQRYFIRKLLDAIGKLENDLYGIHILFATHSPFILSDIHQNKILRLTNGEAVKSVQQYNTFAANIHDLLADEFFLDEGYLGAFAQKQIEWSIHILNYFIADNELKRLPTKGLNLGEQKSVKKKLETDKELYKERLITSGYGNDPPSLENNGRDNAKLYLHELIEVIGEPLIKRKLTKMFNSAFGQDKATKQNEAKLEILRIMQENNINHNDLG